MKFKGGDKVKIVRHRGSPELWGKYVGLVCVINDAWGDVYELESIPGIGWFDDELELAEKPKFNIADYPGKYVMHCKTEEEANVFCKYLHGIGAKWKSGNSLLDNTYFRIYKADTYYSFESKSYVTYGRIGWQPRNYTILEFEDFDWSDFMKKEFTKKDLKNGDVVKRRDGSVEIVCLESGTMICKCGWNPLRDVKDDLTDVQYKEFDIIAVRRPKCASDCQFVAFADKRGELVYERKEVEEMTLEEVCKALGKEIKIVKK